MESSEKNFKLADSFQPVLPEGKYTIKGIQNVTKPEEEHFQVEQDFYITAESGPLINDNLFQVYPAPDQQGDFSGTLPFLVFNDQSYPWLHHWTEAIDGFQVPWLALIVVSQDENPKEMDIAYKQLKDLKEDDVFFPYKESEAASYKEDSNVHILTISKTIYDAVMPDKEDLPWLAHAKFVDLSAAEDKIAEKDGWFSTVIANRFVPSDSKRSVKSTVHLVSVDGYLNGSIPKKCTQVRFISRYHWNVYSEKTEDRSFVSLADGLGKNTKAISGLSVKPHFLRTGEQTYSIYHSPLLPYPCARYDQINGEKKYTSDGRLIYDSKNGIFDTSYAAAFNLGRLITLSHRPEAEQIAAWRKEKAVKNHLDCLEREIGLTETDLKEICIALSEGEKL